MQREFLKQLDGKARQAGFDHVGIVASQQVPDFKPRLASFVAQGLHGDMGWMAEHLERRSHPEKLWPKVRSIVMLGMNYGPSSDPLHTLCLTSKGNISVYARGKDYHTIIKKRLKRVAGWLAGEMGEDVKVFVDTAPVMEKPLAALAGLGWQGKHTNLVSRDFGSWLFLGTIFTTATLPVSQPSDDHCGDCSRCLDICPTNAFLAPYRLDARRCISYLTIEYKGHISKELRGKMGNHVYGCDDCLAVCPWNKFASEAQEMRFHPRGECDNPDLSELLRLDQETFRTRFQGTPIKRAGRDCFIRNCLIASGNSGEAFLVADILPHLEDQAPVVRAMAVWALARLATPEEFARQKLCFLAQETDAAVRREWQEEQAE